MIEDRSLKRLRKKPEDVCGGGLWGRLRSTVRTSTRRPRSLSGSVPFENAEVAEMRDGRGSSLTSRRRRRGAGAEFMEKHGVLTIAMTDGIIGCPHQEGIDHEGESCPVCEFWRGRDRFTGQRVH